MFDIITFGSAAQDIHLKSDAFKVLKDDKDFATGTGICLTLGSKIDVQDIIFTSGGGGTNTAATFVKQGFKTAYYGAVGDDVAGQAIIKELKKLKIDSGFVMTKKEKHTNHSVIISSNGGDRTILVYRGASDLVGKDDLPWKKLKAKWFYLAPLGGKLCDAFGEVVDFAKKNGIKVAINPSTQQLSLSADQFKQILPKVDIMFLNLEEASFFTKIPFAEEQNILKKICEMFGGVAVITKGENGVIASDGKFLYSAPPDPERKFVDATGAGDSFAAGFLSDYIRHNGDIEKAIQLGLANSAANLSEIGAKTGLLDKNSKFERVSVKKQLCSENNLCINK